MVKALGKTQTGQLSLILGLSAESLKVLKQGELIAITLDDLPFPEMEGLNQLANISITLIYGETNTEIRSGLEELMHNAGAPN